MRHRRTVYLTVLATLLAAGTLAAAVGLSVVYLGLYDVAATRQHWKPVYQLLERAMHQSVRLRAGNVPTPPALPEDEALRGAGCFRDHCVQCHGAPGVAQGPIGQSMQPLPGPLVDAARRWTAKELYWLTKHGIRMSGMPAWQHHLDERELWSVVAFLERLPELDVAGYANTVWQADQLQRQDATAACGALRQAAAPPAVGNMDLGRQALYQKACNACHVIPGIVGPESYVGPSLQGFGARTTIAGTLPHTRDNLERWLIEPHRVKPGTAMPAMGLSPTDARHIAAYLADLR